MKKLIWITIFLLIVLFILLPDRASYSIIKLSDDSKLDSFRLVSEYVDENESCFKCHDIQDSLNLKEHQIMTRNEFYSSNHRSLSCIGCHADPLPESPDRTTKEAALARTCSDCHQHLKNNSHFRFAEIDAEYLQSIHHQRKQAEFSCWKCHDPHKDKITIRNNDNIAGVISDDNTTCLSCHKDAGSDSEMHIWLPETEKHFGGVRCIDCHTKINMDLPVAHLVLPKEDAVRKCSQCHSNNSLLLATLYKNQYDGDGVKEVLFNSVVMKDTYVIGANRSNKLNHICLSLLGLTFCGILIHMIPRLLTKPKS